MVRPVRILVSFWAAVLSAFSAAVYAVVPRLVLAADRLRPLFRFTWPSISGAAPPADVLRHFARYDAVALAMRLRSRHLQARAFGVNADGLDAYVQRHVIAETDRMRRWMSAGTGVIYACPHYGPFLLGALLVATQGSHASPSHVFYDPAESVPNNHRFDEFFQQFGDRLSVLHNEPRDLVRALRALKNKQCLSIMFDVVQRPADSMFVPFFDRLYPAMGGAAYLSLQSGAPIIPAYVMPDRGCKARVVFGQPIEPGNFTNADRDKNIYDMTRLLFSDFQKQLVRAPWHWIYWGNVGASSRFDRNAMHDHATLLAEIRRRCLAAPVLLEGAPLLRSLVEGGAESGRGAWCGEPSADTP